MTHALKKFKLLEKTAEEGAAALPPADLVKPQRRKRLDLYDHIASKFESHDEKEARRKRASEARISREEERKRKEEEERQRLEEEKRLKREEAEREERRKQEEEARLQREAELERLAKEALAQQKKQEAEQAMAKGSKLGSITAKSLYEQALASKRQGSKPSGDKVVTLKRGTISDIRNKFFERKPKEEEGSGKKKVAKKKTEEASHTPVDKKVVEEKQISPGVEDKMVASVDANEPKVVTEVVGDEAKAVCNSKKQEKEEIEQKKGNKRQSFITDFAALEKTYRILGLTREPVTIDVPVPSTKKRHSSEGKIKNKHKNNTLVTQVSSAKPQTTPINDKPKLKIEMVEKGTSEARKTFFQELINEKKGITTKEPSLTGPKLRKKTSMASAFEDKSKECNDINKRNSFVKDDVRVDPTLFTTFLNKFEPEDKRAEAKVKIAKITAEQKEFERKKKIMEEERKRKQEQEELELAIQIQLEEQLREQELLAKEEQIRADYEQQSVVIEETTTELTAKKKKIKKKKMEEPLPEERPQLKIGCLAYSESKSKFEKQLQASKTMEETKPVAKINKLDLNPFLENLKVEDKKMNKENVKVTNKLKKNPFFQTLEANSDLLNKSKKTENVKKISTEIKFEKKDRKEKEESSSATTCDLPKQKIRVSKSIESSKQIKKENKNASTFSLFIDNTKQFFKSSKEKLYKLSNETLHEIDQLTEEMSKRISKPSSSEMQNYLLSHVLFDKPEASVGKPEKAKEKKSKEDLLGVYLDKEYKERIEQYCLLVDEAKPKKRKQKQQKEAILPPIKLVEINAIKEQLKTQIERPVEKQLFSENSELFSNCNIKKVQDMFKLDQESKTKETLIKRQKSVNNNIFNRIKSIEEAEKKRLEREKENEERIKLLLERELKNSAGHCSQAQNDLEEYQDETSMEDLKKNIQMCLEDELTNLEQERIELENTEQLLIEQEIAENSDQSFIDTEHSTCLQDIKEELSERKRNATNKKKVLERFKHVFDNDEAESKIESKVNVGSIRDRLELFLQHSESENKKHFEDSVLTGVSDVMNKVKTHFERQPESTPILHARNEVKRRVNPAAFKFERNFAEDNFDETPLQEEKEWSWKNKSKVELENINLNLNKQQETLVTEKPKRHFQDIKYEELLGDIQAVKERLKQRNIEKESEEKNLEMNQFMAEIRGFLREKSNKESSEDESEDDLNNRETNITNKYSAKSPRACRILSLENSKSSPQSPRCKLKPEKKSERKNIDLDNMKQNEVKPQQVLVPKIAELLKPDIESKELIKAPKLLLKSTSFEEEEERPVKTLEELKMEQQNRKWSYKEKSIKDLQDFIKVNENLAPQSFKQQQKTLQDLEDELDVVTNLVTDNKCDIIEQIQEEKDKEISNFMNDVKSYVNNATSTDEREEDFRNKIKSYLDLIDDTKEEGKYQAFPALSLNRINQVKQQLLVANSSGAEIKKTIPPVRKLEPSTIQVLQTQDSGSKTVEKKDIDICKKNILSIKDIYEQSKTEIVSPKVARVACNPALEKLKAMKSSDKTIQFKFQLTNKSKTITEAMDYIEGHEDIASPKIIEIIYNFKIVRKEEDKMSLYIKFIECVNAFIQQNSRSEDQALFKENIKAYLDIIENSDPLLNGTPKLKKHSVSNSSNNKKDQIEKDNKNMKTAQDNGPEKKLMSPENQRKEILAKYGLKDRVLRQISIESSCSSDEEDISEGIKNLSDKELCSRYGLPELYIPEQQKRQESNNNLISLISKIRNTSTFRVTSPNYDILSSENRSDVCKGISSEELPKQGLSSKMMIKNMFEQALAPGLEKNDSSRRNLVREFPNELTQPSERKYLSPVTVRKFSLLQRSSTIGNFPINAKLENSSFLPNNSQAHSLKNAETCASMSVERSSSFSKVKNAFENGIGLNENSDSDSDCENFTPSKIITSELQALKRDSKIQNMFRLCRSDSDPTRSPKPTRVLDKSTMQQVAKSKSAITNMFESQAPKITFGGGSLMQEQPPKAKKVEKTKSAPLDSRKWVFDTIQKYFDVIVEEEQDADNDSKEIITVPTIPNEKDPGSESDYTSAEEEIPSVPSTPFSPRVTVSNKFNLNSYFQRDKERRCSSVTGQPIRKVSIDDFVADAAKQFDELANSSNTSLYEAENKRVHETVRAKHPMASSCQNINQLSKSGSSSKIRGLFSSVVHGSGSNLDLTVFKSNLLAHLSSRKATGSATNLDPGVRDDSSSEYSEYDD